MIRVSFSSFLSLSLFDVILNFYKKYFITVIIIIIIIIYLFIYFFFLFLYIFFFMESIFFFMFRDVPGSSGMFCVSGFIDTPMFNDQRQLICNRK